MIDLVESRLDVKLNNPVILPATLARQGNRLFSRLARPVSIGIRMKYRIECRLDHELDNTLSNSIRHGGHAQLSRAALGLRYLHLLHGRREVRPRRHPVPQLVEISRE